MIKQNGCFYRSWENNRYFTTREHKEEHSFSTFLFSRKNMTDIFYTFKKDL